MTVYLGLTTGLSLGVPVVSTHDSLESINVCFLGKHQTGKKGDKFKLYILSLASEHPSGFVHPMSSHVLVNAETLAQ